MNTFRYRLDGRVYDLPTRDSQKAKLYRAERVAFGTAFGTLLEDGSVAACERYVRRVTSSKTWAKLLSEARKSPGPIEVEDGRGCRIARGSGYSIKLPRWARTVPVILHELAHVARPLARHNWPFADAFLRLVSRFLGVDEAARLLEAFRRYHVRVRPKKTFSPEVREKLRQRGLALAAARQNPDGVPA